MSELFKKTFFRFAEIWRGSGSPRRVIFGLSLAAILMAPNLGYGQGLYGDPSGTLGRFGGFKLEVGTGSTVNPNLHINNKPVSLTIPQGTFNLTASDTIVKIRTKQVFLTATLGLGSSLDAFIKVGHFKAQDGFDGSNEPSGGLGFRFSPDQTGRLKMGFLFQAFYASSENNSYPASINTEFNTDSRGITRSVNATGTGADKLRLIQYDGLLSLSVQDIPYVRPYGALLLSYQDRTEKGSFSGQGDLTICSSISGCQVATGRPMYLSWNTDTFTDSVVGGVFGLSIKPFDRGGINLEGFIGAGHLGTQYGYTASAFVNF